MIEPKLAMIPSAVKLIGYPSNAKVYSVLPNDGTGDFSGGNSGLNKTAKYNENLLVEFGSEPRLDWYSNQNCPTLLIEPSRTNSLSYSNKFNTYWTLGEITVLENAGISPDGLKNAWKITGTNNYGVGLQQTVYRGTYASTYENYSIFVKRGENGGQDDRLFFKLSSPNGGLNYFEFDFDLKYIYSLYSNNIFLRETNVKELPNDWYRLEMGFDMDLSYQTIFQVTTQVNTSSYIWGAQREQTGEIFSGGSPLMPSSYIETPYSSWQTRGYDFYGLAGNSLLFDNPEGSLFFDFQEIFNDYVSIGTRSVSILKSNVASERIMIQIYSAGYVDIRYSTASGSFFPTGFVINLKQRNKFALTWNQNTFKVSHNGTIKSEDSHNLGLPNGLDSLNLDDGFQTNSNKFYGEINDIRYYDKLLSNTDLTQLTAI